MLLQQSIEPVFIVYTCNTYFVMHWSLLFIQECHVNGSCNTCKSKRKECSSHDFLVSNYRA